MKRNANYLFIKACGTTIRAPSTTLHNHPTQPPPSHRIPLNTNRKLRAARRRYISLRNLRTLFLSVQACSSRPRSSRSIFPSLSLRDSYIFLPKPIGRHTVYSQGDLYRVALLLDARRASRARTQRGSHRV